ncbi:nucleotidyltransferase family protein [Thiomicrospira sp. ALE5]|uniref:nucleotidyltransferase family protein n=1 Tax=Thiomicrospira sp. ALE5 TaxID=748650 RepID=UPI000B80D0E4|nr:nucleotidyltransferase domain-containing protein [Thiomicrospira sp. ALE5]
MRLNQQQIEAIKKTFVQVFGLGDVYLFGSRVDEQARGGDIDLYVVPTEFDNLALKKVDFLVKLQHLIGEQKIDLVFDKGQNRAIDQLARQQGILLCSQH